jgi:adenylate kinase
VACVVVVLAALKNREIGANRYTWVPISYAPVAESSLSRLLLYADRKRSWHKATHRSGEVVRTILIGPPSAGKSTQAYKLAAKFAIPHISTGQLLRESVSVGSRLGMTAKHHLEDGDLVPSSLTNALVADRISQTDCRRYGFILDGYPRSVEQAAKLTRSLAARDTSIDTVLSLHVCEDELLTRAKRRARADDIDEVVLQTRLKMYREQTAPLLDYYSNKLVSVDGAGSIDEVFTRVLRAVGR